MINEDKAYVLGLIVGGGTISYNTFNVKLPFKQWGKNVATMPTIANDILMGIRDIFKRAYNVEINFIIQRASWTIIPLSLTMEELDEIKKDLHDYGLPTSGFILKNADLSIIKSSFSDLLAGNFLAGVFDTRGSVVPSQRRFAANAPTVSLEIPGSTENFKFVIQICSWMHKLGTTTDQILFNHPSQQSAHDAYYTGWKKGFKIRFLVSSFLESSSFAFKSKAHSANNLLNDQTKDEQPLCEHREVSTPSSVCIHRDIHSPVLPPEVRGKIFLHYLHFCAVLGCPYAPTVKMEALAQQYGSAISVCTLLTKGTVSRTTKTYSEIQNKYFPHLSLNQASALVSTLRTNPQYAQYRKLDVALAYLFSPTLKGARHVGNMADILDQNSSSSVQVISPGLGYPLHIINSQNGRSVILSSISSSFNQAQLKREIQQSGLTLSKI